MAKFNTFREAVEDTLAKFEEVKKLNKVIDPPSRLAIEGCFYDGRVNGIGCAIGCQFDPQDQYILDTDPERSHGYIADLLASPKLAAIVRQVYGPDITIDQLRTLQRWHDHASTYEEFRDKMANYLIEHPEPEAA